MKFIRFIFKLISFVKCEYFLPFWPKNKNKNKMHKKFISNKYAYVGALKIKSKEVLQQFKGIGSSWVNVGFLKVQIYYKH